MEPAGIVLPAITLRTQIIDHIAGRITSGEWAAGALVPTERELMAQFGASRMTVHNALRDLTSRGFLTRRKGAGTYVAEPRPYASHFDHLDIVEEVTARGGVHSARIIRREIRMPGPDEAAVFAAQGPLFHAVVLHCENGVPVELEDRLLDPVSIPGCVTVDLSKRSLFSTLMLVRPYREGSETVRPVLPDAAERKLLAMPKGEPALEMVRKTWTSDGIITVARLLRVRQASCLSGRISSDGRLR